MKRLRRAAAVSEYLDLESRLCLRLLERQSEDFEDGQRVPKRAHPYTFVTLDEKEEKEYWFDKSTWRYLNLRCIRDENSTAGQKFRRRHCIPYSMFEDIYTDMESWKNPDGTFFYSKRIQKDRPPVKHKLSAYLNVLSQASTFDNIEWHWGISERAAQRGFHDWTKEFVARYWAQWCSPPTAEELIEVERIYRRLGFPGCIGSMDGVHLGWACCPAQLYHEHKGKEGFPSLVYNVIVDHVRRIYSATKGNPGTVSDKTAVKFDSFVLELKENKAYPDFRYPLRREQRPGCDGPSHIFYNRPYLMNDGGYLEWVSTMHADKQSTNTAHIHWRKRLESVRKDTECTFGSMKKRFTILKTHLRYWTSDKIDNVFWTCCIIHNMLLKFDGWQDRANDPMFWRSANDISADLSPPNFSQDDDMVGNDPRCMMGYNPPDDMIADVEPGFKEKRLALIEHFECQLRNKELEWLH